MSSTPTVAVSADFLDAFSKIPRSQQRKVRAFITKFQEDPRAPSLHYEPIHDMLDERVRTVRIDQSYRAVVLHPSEGTAFVLVWVDNHDEAMAWAKNKRFRVNPSTGSLQVIDTAALEADPTDLVDGGDAEDDKALQGYNLFETFAEEELLRTGLPEPLLPAVRAVRDEDGLDALQPYLPVEAYEALWWVAQGMSVPEALAEVSSGAKIEPREVDTEDIAAALEHPDSQRRFVVVRSASELERVLDAPLERWRVFLHPSQRELVERHFNGPARATGGAGTGKTVVAMHRARHLAAEVFTAPQDRVLFTTFTRNLADNIEANLRSLCGPEMARIEVTNLDRWTMGLLRREGLAIEMADDETLDACWREALADDASPGRPAEVYREEWEQVVLEQDLRDRDDYLRASRRGQGRPLTRPQRAEIWQVMEAFKAALDRRGKTEWGELPNLARRFLEQRKPDLPYRAIVVDETQDLGMAQLRLLRAMVPEGPNDLFLVGDAHQRIYGWPVVLSHCGIDVRGRSSRLKINYRTTEQIRDWAMRVLSGEHFDDLDGASESSVGYRSLLSGPKPTLRHFDDPEEELTWIAARIDDLLRGDVPSSSICVVAHRTRQVSKLQHGLERLDIPALLLDGRTTDAGEGVRMATMHRVKGLEFAHLFLAGANADALPDEPPGGDPLAALRLRCLVHVAATRARDTLTVTSAGQPSALIGG